MTSEPEPAALRIALFQGEATPAKPLYLAKRLASDGYVDVAVLKIVKTLDGKPVSGLDLPTGAHPRLEQPSTASLSPLSASRRWRWIRTGDQRLARCRVGLSARLAHPATAWLDQDGRCDRPRQLRWARCGSDRSADRNPHAHSVRIESCDPMLLGRGHARKNPADRACSARHPYSRGRSDVDQSVCRRGDRTRTFQALRQGEEPAGQFVSYDRVQSYSSDASSYTAVFDASGLAAGEDLEFVALYAPDSQSTRTHSTPSRIAGHEAGERHVVLLGDIRGRPR